MVKISKKRKIIITKLDKTKKYTLQDASSLIKEITTVKFDASVDISVRLGVDPKKANEMVRGVVTLPNGTQIEEISLVIEYIKKPLKL